MEWIEEVGGGEVTHLHRHVARREAWVVDVTRPDGSVFEAFLRLQRDPAGVDPRRLERETRITQALERTDIPVTPVYGWNADLRATLFARDPGRSDIDKLEDATEQRAIMEDFMRSRRADAPARPRLARSRRHHGAAPDDRGGDGAR